MPTLIDSLAIELNLDPRQFAEGLREASTGFKKAKEEAVGSASEIERQGKRASAFFSELRNQLVGLYAFFVTSRGLKEFVEDVTAADASTGRLARSLGITERALGSWAASRS